MLRSIAVAALLAVTAVPALAQGTNTPPPAGCDTPEDHQFDFWIGKWDVYPKAAPDRLVAHSLIEKLYAGCAVRENWMPLKGPGGGSFSAFVPGDKSWRQTWISVGGFADFKGGLDGKSMVITGVWPQPGHPMQQTRMTYTPLPDGSVEQSGVTSDDNGKTWQPSFDFIYRKAGPASQEK